MKLSYRIISGFGDLSIHTPTLITKESSQCIPFDIWLYNTCPYLVFMGHVC